MGYFAWSVTKSDYKYDILREDYTRRLEMQSRDYEMRYNRLQEQMTSLQFTIDKRQHLLEEQLQMYRSEKQK